MYGRCPGWHISLIDCGFHSGPHTTSPHPQDTTTSAAPRPTLSRSLIVVTSLSRDLCHTHGLLIGSRSVSRFCQGTARCSTASIRKITYEADRRGYVQRGRTERKHRRVGMRPAPDTMAVLTGYLSVEQGVACYTALQQHADATVATGDGRSWPARSWPPVGDVNGGAGSSPHPPPPQPALGRLWVGIRPGGTSTAG